MRPDPITQLRSAIDSLPVRTREAMLEGIRSNPIVVGAYTDNEGGICPMLAAHRHGGRVTLLAFARSWDRFTGAHRVRRASRRELRILEAQLVASLMAEEHVDLEAAIADHRDLQRRSRTEREIVARRLTRSTTGVRRLRPRRRAEREALRRLEQELTRV